ncbi:MAG: acetyltransferase [Pedobacter sp.]|nr:MAG: acetyltransferase [Pedobacter sp.]
MNIVGASGHAKVIIEILKLTGQPIDNIWDDNSSLIEFEGFTVKGNSEMLSKTKSHVSIIAIGNNRIRKRIAEMVGGDFEVAIHPKSSISPTAYIGKGTVIMANATVSSCVNLGKHVIINTNASVDHDCKIGDFAHISPQAGIAGGVSIGEGTHVGIGASIIQGLKIGNWATIGAGAVVLKDVPDFAVVVGNPARIIKYNHEFEQ